MTTTNANGIVFLEETDPISPFHTLMNVLQQGTSDALDEKAAAVLTPLTADWLPYTPTWTASGVNPSLGSGGAIAGRYRKIGRTVEFSLWMVLGSSGASGGSGGWRWSLPVQAGEGLFAVTGHLRTASDVRSLSGIIASTVYIEDVVTGTGVSLSSGFTLTAGSRVLLSGTYRSES